VHVTSDFVQILTDFICDELYLNRITDFLDDTLDNMRSKLVAGEGVHFAFQLTQDVV